MRLCRYNDNRLGLVEDDRVADVTAALDAIPQYTWPLPPGDLLIRHLDAVRARVADVRRAPIASPSPMPISSVRSPIRPRSSARRSTTSSISTRRWRTRASRPATPS